MFGEEISLFQQENKAVLNHLASRSANNTMLKNLLNLYHKKPEFDAFLMVICFPSNAPIHVTYPKILKTPLLFSSDLHLWKKVEHIHLKHPKFSHRVNNYVLNGRSTYLKGECEISLTVSCCKVTQNHSKPFF